jgi:hypothetical protein
MRARTVAVIIAPDRRTSSGMPFVAAPQGKSGTCDRRVVPAAHKGTETL